MDKGGYLFSSALSFPDISLMYSIGRRKVLDSCSRHSLWLMPLIHSMWLMITLTSINSCYHLWEFKNPHRVSNHSSVYWSQVYFQWWMSSPPLQWSSSRWFHVKSLISYIIKTLWPSFLSFPIAFIRKHAKWIAWNICRLNKISVATFP